MARKSRKNVETCIADVAPTIKAYNTAAYIRLSVEDNKKKGDSVETQKAILENFISLAPEIKLHGFYIDNGISGSTFEREAFIPEENNRQPPETRRLSTFVNFTCMATRT